jgi:hypothetical protein
MTSKPLPENIDKIREAGAEWLFNKFRKYVGAKPAHLSEQPDHVRATWLDSFDSLALKLDELGVVKLADEEMPPFGRDLDYIVGILADVYSLLGGEEEPQTSHKTYIENAALKIRKLYPKVVSIVTGTPKEG